MEKFREPRASITFSARKGFALKKIFRMVRFTLFCFFLSLLQVMAVDSYSQQTRLTLNQQNQKLEDVLRAIEDKSEFFFLYNKDLIDVDQTVNINKKDQTINVILDELLKGTDIKYSVINRQIILSNLEGISGLNNQQQKSISGRVTDSSGASLPGVSVVVKGTTTGVITDMDGKYSISNIPENVTLQFSFVGMKIQEIAVGGKTSINVTLSEETIALDEVVSVAYGKASKSTLTSSISTVKANSLVDAPVGNVSNNLSGRMAGVLTFQASGEPGLDASIIRIRGQNTIGNSAPLVIIDGVPGDMNRLNVKDIENMSILKDAAAVAPYGLAAANGVILITTKKGLKESTKFAYSASFGIQNPVYLTKTINSYQQALMRNEMYLNDNPNNTNVPYSNIELEEYRKVCAGDPTGNYDKYFNSQNLRDVIRHNSPINTHNLSIKGGSQTVTYFASLGYLKQGSMIPNENFERYNGLFNLEADLNKTLKLTLSVKMDQSIREWPSFGGQVTAGFGIYARCYEIAPNDPIWYPNTEGLWANGAFGYNPVGRIYTSGKRDDKTFNTNYTLSLEKQLPIKGLSIKGSLYYENDNLLGTNWNEEPIYWDVDNTKTPAEYIKREPTRKPSLDKGYYQNKSIIAQGFINYSNTFGKHDVNGIFVSELRNASYEGLWAGRKNYDILIHTLSMGSSNQADISNGGEASESRQAGLVLKLGYKYDNKYLVDFSGRLDKHYYFAPGHRAGYFPAVSVGWRMGQEKFIKDNLSWIDELKLRASWGESGNLAGQQFQYLSSYGVWSESYRLGGLLGQALMELSPANPNITWEKQKQTDIGFDISLWNGLLSFNGDYFYQVRNNMLLSPNVILPGEYGIGLPQENAGKMSNKGFEFTIGTKHNFNNGILFDANVNFTFARNKLLQIFENSATYDDVNRRRTGHPMGSQFGLVSLGFFQNEDEVKNSPKQQFGNYTVGDVKYADINQDGKVDGTDEKMIGHPNFPECIIGLNLSAKWKGFDVGALIQGATSVSVFRPGAAGGGLPGVSNGNTQIEGLDHWTPETPNAMFPRWSEHSRSNNSQLSTLYMRDGTYFRLKNFSVGYTLSSNIVKMIKLESFRFYLSGQNMLTWTKDNLNSDPENASGTVFSFANQKAMSVGIEINF